MKEKEIYVPDIKDKKILYELDFNARIPFSQLAKKVGLSKQGTEYRVNNLIKKGVINGFYPIINVPKLGYFYCRMSFSFKNLTLEKEQEILNYLEKNEKVFWVFTTRGYFDLLVALWTRSLKEFILFRNEFLGRFSENIDKKFESLNTDVIFYQNRFLLRTKETLEINLQETSQKIELDKLDQEILRVLCFNARFPITDIAKRVKASAKVVAYRLRGLEKSHLIEGYRPVIDYNRLGYAYYKIWFELHNFNHLKMQKLYQYIKDNPITLYLIKGIGFPGDLDIEVIVKSNQELYHFIRDLKLKFPDMIGEQKIFMFQETKKVRFLPF